MLTPGWLTANSISASSPAPRPNISAMGSPFPKRSRIRATPASRAYCRLRLTRSPTISTPSPVAPTQPSTASSAPDAFVSAGSNASILRAGLGFDECDVGVVLNVLVVGLTNFLFRQVLTPNADSLNSPERLRAVRNQAVA